MTPRRNFIAGALLFLAGWAAGPPLARATVAITSTDPSWTFDPTEIERQVASFAKANGITTQSGWTTFINSLTAGQSTATSQGLLRAVKCSNP